MFPLGRKIQLETARLILRPARMSDFVPWACARRNSQDFLRPWEPTWPVDHLTRRAFRQRVVWGRRAIQMERACPFMMFERETGDLVGGVVLDTIRRGPAQAASIGYWTAASHARRGYMREALTAVRSFAFDTLDLSRIEAGCLPENIPSRALLEQCSFKYEGVAQAYLQINGRWRDHVLYACLRGDRRGRVITD